MKEFFFLTEARDFNKYCFPDEAKWQLQEKATKWSEFTNGPLCKPELFALGLFIAKPRFGVVKGDATVRVEVSVPTDQADKVIVHHRLNGLKVITYVEKEDTISNDSMPISPYGSTEDLQVDLNANALNVLNKLKALGLKNRLAAKPVPVKNDPENGENTNTAAPEGNNGTVKTDAKVVENGISGGNTTVANRKQSRVDNNVNNKIKVRRWSDISQSQVKITTTEFPKHLERYVYLFYSATRYIFEVDLPIGGEYQFDILGDFIDYNQPVKNVRKLPLLCRFKLVKEGVPNSIPPTCPIIPEIGWGPNPYMARYGLKPQSHQDGRVIISSTDEFTIQFELFGNNLFHDLKLQTRLRSNDHKPEALEKRTRQVILGDALYVRASLPAEGSYALKMFAKRKGENGFKNICNYMIIFGNPQIKNPFNDIKDDVSFSFLERTYF